MPTPSQPSLFSPPLLLLLVGLLLSGVPTAHASDAHDHEQARQAVLRGEVLPLAQILGQLALQRPQAKVLEVELERKGGRWIYEIKQLEANGQLIKLKLNAQTGEVLHLQERPSHGNEGSEHPRRRLLR